MISMSRLFPQAALNKVSPQRTTCETDGVTHQALTKYILNNHNRSEILLYIPLSPLVLAQQLADAFYGCWMIGLWVLDERLLACLPSSSLGPSTQCLKCYQQYITEGSHLTLHGPQLCSRLYYGKITSHPLRTLTIVRQSFCFTSPDSNYVVVLLYLWLLVVTDTYLYFSRRQI